LGCGCGRIARALKEPWFEGSYVGIDIDDEMLEYCRNNFPSERFKFARSPHKSATYSAANPHDDRLTIGHDLLIAEPNSKDFVYAFTLYTHLLEKEVTDYLQETYRILRPQGIMYLNFLCIEHVELGGRWTFQHRRGNAYVESVRYPEAAVAYHEAFMTGLATNCGFRDVTVTPPLRGGQTELVGRK
jgi:SAM-dependent methyltransferase